MPGEPIGLKLLETRSTQAGSAGGAICGQKPPERDDAATRQAREASEASSGLTSEALRGSHFMPGQIARAARDRSAGCGVTRFVGLRELSVVEFIWQCNCPSLGMISMIELGRSSINRFGHWIAGQIIQDVPDDIALCEFDCRKVQCGVEECETCPRRLKRGAGELLPSRPGRIG